ncbi:MAG: helix-turn-helix domain-containing protein [Haloferacaceae archaeon]
MKSLTLRLDPGEAGIHPMHAFVADDPAYGPTRLLQWNPRVDVRNVLLFHVDGPTEPFLSALDDVGTADVVEPAEMTALDGFFLYVRERLDGPARELVRAYAGEDVVVMPPVVYDVDESIRLTVVGVADAVQRAVDRTPASVDVSVQRIHSGADEVVPLGGGLTDRQREVVAAAVDAGYYEEPRAATLADVAETLDCASSTVAEHLRKAESTLVRHVVSAPVGPGTGDR